MEFKGAQADQDSYSVPSAYKVCSHNRRNVSQVDLPGVLTSGQLRLMSVALPSGFVLTKMAWLSGTTAAVTPTNYWACLLTPTLEVLAVSTDLLTAAWAANTLKSFTFTSYTLRRAPGDYYAGLMFAGATPPSLQGTLDASTLLATQAQIIGGNSSTAGLTVPGGLTVGSTAGAITASGSKPIVLVG